MYDGGPAAFILRGPVLGDRGTATWDIDPQIGLVADELAPEAGVLGPVTLLRPL